MRVDVHQHIWTEPLLEVLRSRSSLPFVRPSAGSAVLHSAGEQPYAIDVATELPARRAQMLQRDGLDLAVIALSSPVGIEALPREAARELIDAHLDGVGDLPDGFAAWGPVALDQPDPDDIDAVLARGCVGISLPAPALAGADALAAVGPLLERIAAREVPVFIHPGGPPRRSSYEASLTEPSWWRALTDYVAQMHAAWLTFAALGRREHPDLVAVFAMLAGGAPLLSERLGTRGGPAVELGDPRIYYDSSSYGPVAIEAMARRVGSQQLVFGSDRPVLEPIPFGRETILQEAGARLLASVGSPA